MKGERDGWFLVPKGWIGEGELGLGEAVLFSNKREVKYVAHAASGREDNNGRDADKFPYKFRMDPNSIRKVKVPLEELQRWFDSAGVKVNLRGRGWTKIAETPESKLVFEKLRNGGAVV